RLVAVAVLAVVGRVRGLVAVERVLPGGGVALLLRVLGRVGGRGRVRVLALVVGHHRRRGGRLRGLDDVERTRVAVALVGPGDRRGAAAGLGGLAALVGLDVLAGEGGGALLLVVVVPLVHVPGLIQGLILGGVLGVLVRQGLVGVGDRDVRGRVRGAV